MSGTNYNKISNNQDYMDPSQQNFLRNKNTSVPEKPNMDIFDQANEINNRYQTNPPVYQESMNPPKNQVYDSNTSAQSKFYKNKLTEKV